MHRSRPLRASAAFVEDVVSAKVKPPLATLFASIGVLGFAATYGYNIAVPVITAYGNQSSSEEGDQKD